MEDNNNEAYNNLIHRYNEICVEIVKQQVVCLKSGVVCHSCCNKVPVLGCVAIETVILP